MTLLVTLLVTLLAALMVEPMGASMKISFCFKFVVRNRMKRPACWLSKGRHPSAFDALADGIDDGTIASPEDYLKLHRGNKSNANCRVRAMISLYGKRGTFLPSSNPLDVALSVWWPSVTPLIGTARIIVGHVRERELRRLQYELPSSEVTRGSGVCATSRFLDTRFSLQELIVRSKRKKSALAAKLWEASSHLSYRFFLENARVHNVNFTDDPPVQAFVATVRFLRLLSGAKESAVFLFAIFMAAGRSVEVQHWAKASLEFHEWVRVAGFDRPSLDRLRYIIVGKCRLGDGATTETLLDDSDYAYSVLTSSLYQLCSESQYDDFANVQDSYALFLKLDKIKGYGSFRANHISLWVSVAFGLDIHVPEGMEKRILGPKLRLFRRWIGSRFTFSDLMEECVRQLENEPVEFLEKEPGGAIVAHPMRVLFTPTVLEFTVCKVVQGIRLLVELRVRGIRWRAVYGPQCVLDADEADESNVDDSAY